MNRGGNRGHKGPKEEAMSAGKRGGSRGHGGPKEGSGAKANGEEAVDQWKYSRQ